MNRSRENKKSSKTTTQYAEDKDPDWEIEEALKNIAEQSEKGEHQNLKDNGGNEEGNNES